MTKVFRNLTIITLALLLILIPTNNVFADELGQKYDNLEKSEISLITESVKKFELDDKEKPFSDRVKLVNIETDKISKLSTPALLEIIMDYPFIGNIVAFDDFNMGLDSLINVFDPLKTFIDREDAAKAVENKYTEIRDEKGKFIEKTFLEALGNRLNYSFVNEDSLTTKTASLASTTYVTTPNGSDVEVLIRGELLTVWDKIDINNYYDTTYPQATRIGDSTTNYNCHSYAWYLSSTSNTYWMNSPVAYYADGSYTQTTSTYGKKAVYFSNPNITVAMPIHSAIVSGTIFISKWGEAGLYQHAPGHSPYNTQAPYIYYFK